MKDEAISLSLKTDSYQDWAKGLLEYAESGKLLQEAAYWNNIENAEILPYPKDFNGLLGTISDIRTLTITVDKNTTAKLLTKTHQTYNTEMNDILLSSLGLALKEWTRQNNILISTEGHGREPILDEMNISRTVGWFTSIYPIILDMNHSDDISYQIRSIKENLRKIPHNGIGYGILKYLSKTGNFKSKITPEILFNYLGQFDSLPMVELSNLSSGPDISYGAEIHTNIELNGLVANGELNFTLKYSEKQYKPETMKLFSEMFRNQLIKVIEHCTEKGLADEKKYTPSDFGDKSLSLDDLQQIINQVEK